MYIFFSIYQVPIIIPFRLSGLSFLVIWWEATLHLFPHLFWLVDLQFRGIGQAILPFNMLQVRLSFPFLTYKIKEKRVLLVRNHLVCSNCKNKSLPFLTRHGMHIFRLSAMFIFCCSFQTPSLRPQSSDRCRGFWLQIVTSTTAVFLYSLVLYWHCLTKTSAEIVV